MCVFLSEVLFFWETVQALVITVLQFWKISPQKQVLPYERDRLVLFIFETFINLCLKYDLYTNIQKLWSVRFYIFEISFLLNKEAFFY